MITNARRLSCIPSVLCFCSLFMSKRFLDFLWWLGVPLIIGILTWGPYVYLNITNNVSWSFWRIPFVPIYVFDSSAYYQWIGAALSGLAYGSHIRSFDWIIRILGHIIPSSWSVAEVWLLTLWVSATVGIWLMAKCIALWSDCSVGYSRWFSVIALSSFMLPFMPRPGVYTWYVGFYALSLIGIWHAQRNLDRLSYLPAVAWTVTSLLAAWVYPYFLIHIFLWLVALWLIHLHHRFPKAIRAIGGVGIIAVIPAVVLMMPVILQPELRLIFELQERVGLALTRLPVISNSLLLAFLWMGFLVLCARVFFQQSVHHERLYGLMVGWIALLAGWFSNVFTGVYIHNDHFRNPILLFSWVSLFVIFRIAQKANSQPDQLTASDQKRDSHASSRLVLMCFFVSCAMFCAYLFQKGYVFHGDLLNAVHVSHWLTLVAASYVVWRYTRNTRVNPAFVIVTISFLAMMPGALGRGQVFVQETKVFSSYEMHVPTIEWIREHTAESDGICADPELAEVLGSFSARLVYPTYATAMLPKPDRGILNDLRIELGYFSPSNGFEEGVYLHTFDSMRGTTCDQFGLFSRLSVAFGVRSEVFDVMANCPRKEMDEHAGVILGFLNEPYRNDDAFRALCPFVVMSEHRRASWSLPSDYHETKIDDTFSVWRTGVSRL